MDDPARPLRGKTLQPRTGESWNAFFRRARPGDDAVRETVMQFHLVKRHNDAIAVIEAALINGRSEPWMYDVLALSMKLAGRPAEDVERALLSRIDFTAVDVPSMLYSAAYLNRFGAKQQSLSLYQQASRLAPLRAEPYVLGLRIARDLEDWEAVAWAARGVLRAGWLGDYERLQRNARSAAAEANRALLAAGKRQVAEQLRKAVAEASEQDLHIMLTWSGAGDVDLLVDEPGGDQCSFRNRQTASGGFLVHDGSGPEQRNCREEYVCPFAAAGTYRVRVRHVHGNIVGKRAVLKITRSRHGERESVKQLTIPLRSDDVIVSVPVPNGRAEASEAPRPNQTANKP